MNNVKTLNKWANAHTYLPVDLLRMALGVFLFIKGVYFFSNAQYLLDLLSPIQSLDRFGSVEMFAIHYIAPAHLVGGILIFCGLLTRWAVISQLPILISAVIINFMGQMHQQNLTMALIAVAISFFFLFYGSGKNSADYFFKMQV